MSTLSDEQLPVLASALVRLRGETLTAISAATGIRGSNLSVWLRGKEQVIAKPRVAMLLHHLGVEGGTLRPDQLHHWNDHGALADLKTVFGMLRMPTAETWVFEDDSISVPRIRFVRSGQAWVRLSLLPGATASADLADVVLADRILLSKAPLSLIPDSLAQAQEALTACEQSHQKNDEQHIEAMLSEMALQSDLPLDISLMDEYGWSDLRLALHTALDKGHTPAEIAKVLSAHCQ